MRSVPRRTASCLRIASAIAALTSLINDMTKWRDENPAAERRPLEAAGASRLTGLRRLRRNNLARHIRLLLRRRGNHARDRHAAEGCRWHRLIYRLLLL